MQNNWSLPMALVLTPDGGDHLVIAYLSELKPAYHSDLSRSFQWLMGCGTMTINPQWPWPLHCLYRVWARILFWFWLMEHHNQWDQWPVTVACIICIWCEWDDIDVHQCQWQEQYQEQEQTPLILGIAITMQILLVTRSISAQILFWFWLMEHYNGTSVTIACIAGVSEIIFNVLWTSGP